MKYSSTRGQVNDRTFQDALFSGYASDGGIYMPESIPRVDVNTLKQWSKLSYPQLVSEVLSLFISPNEIPRLDLQELVGSAFKEFTAPEVLKMAKLSGNLNVLELFHGPTLAFKDLAMCVVGRLLDYYLQQLKHHVIIIVGTSGDTGSAAIHSVLGLTWVDIVVLLPRGRCSRIQEQQMTTVLADNVHIFRVDGTSDDLDAPIAQCFADANYVAKHRLMSINSINWARIVVQIAHYFYAYLQTCPSCDGEVEIVIPTGACGNVTAGCVAHQMGLPIKMVCSVNTNDIVARTINHGDFSMSKDVIPTLAPAMDIQMPYNMERLVWIFSEHDVKLVQKLQGEVEKNGHTRIPEDILTKLQKVVSSCSVSDAGIRSSMVRCWEENEYLLCPHTATAAWYHYNHERVEGVSRVCVATASPAKFEEAVLDAGLIPQPTEEIKALDGKPTRYQDLEKDQDWFQVLKDTIQSISEKRSSEH